MSKIKLFRYDPPTSILYPREIEFMTFPGGEEHVKATDNDLWAPAETAFIIDARLSDSSGLLRVMLLADMIRSKVRRPHIHLFCPYLPAARQDRGAPLSAKVYADLINSADFDSVISVDTHSDVMPALIRNEYHIPIERVFLVTAFPGPTRAVLLIPDAGAIKRVTAVADKFGYQTVQAYKKRDPKTGALSDFEVGRIPDGADAIIVDDICDGGGTFLGLAEAVSRYYPKDHAPKLHLWVTHGIFSKGPWVLERDFTNVCCTDSFPIKSGNEDYHTSTFRLTRVHLSDTLQSLANNKEFM